MMDDKSTPVSASGTCAIIPLQNVSADKPKARELYRAPCPECFAIEGLKWRGAQPWLDAADLIPGQNWEVETHKAV